MFYKYLLISFGLFCMSTALNAQAQDYPPYLEKAREIYYSWEDTQRGLDLIEANENDFYSASKVDNAWLQGEIYFIKANLHAQLGNKKVAESIYWEGLQLAEESVTEWGTADFYAQAGILRAQWMTVKGIGTILKNGGKVLEYADEAIKRDDKQFVAHILQAQSLIHAPSFAGGDPKKAITILSSIENERDSKIEDYEYLTAMGMAEKKLKNWKVALNYFSQAALIYPSNEDVQALISETSKKIK